jgi:hypothetical protein
LLLFGGDRCWDPDPGGKLDEIQVALVNLLLTVAFQFVQELKFQHCMPDFLLTSIFC